MKFGKKFSKAKRSQQFQFEGSEVIKCKGEREPCWHCKELTNWADVSFMAYLCSEECSRAKWKEYEEACNE